ncbi:MAG: thiamine diphosphokinase [Lachnospiraceae bacterium]|jgi:thiamine pyrophosphokinase|nr:thiamine diphosphokinase [Lachnospiraceae bacterium]
MKTALIIAGGETEAALLKAETAKLRREGGLLIAADRGLEALEDIRELPDVAVGDFDSVKPETLAAFEQCEGVRFERHRPQKNESDTELAFSIAAEEGVTDVILMGGTGTRLDHTLSNIHLLKAAMDRKLDCVILDSHNRIRLVRGRTVFRRNENAFPYISFIPLTQEVTHITLTGFRYPLTDYHMTLGKECSLCVSNELEGEEAVLEFGEGLLLAIESRD